MQQADLRAQLIFQLYCWKMLRTSWHFFFFHCCILKVFAVYVCFLLYICKYSLYLLNLSEFPLNYTEGTRTTRFSLSPHQMWMLSLLASTPTHVITTVLVLQEFLHWGIAINYLPPQWATKTSHFCIHEAPPGSLRALDGDSFAMCKVYFFRLDDNNLKMLSVYDVPVKVAMNSWNYKNKLILSLSVYASFVMKRESLV